MDEKIHLDDINLSTIPHAPPANRIVNRIDLAIELFHINTHQTKKINLSLLIPDQHTSEYYGIYIFYCADAEFFYQTLTHNIYETYQVFRQPHEAQGWRFKTKGARENAQISGMLASYGGFNAYLIERIDETTCKSTSRQDLVGIFEYDATISENDTVIAQKVFHENMWRNTLESARKGNVPKDLLNHIMGK